MKPIYVARIPREVTPLATILNVPTLLYVIFALMLIIGCSDDGWNDARYNLAVQGCKNELLAPPIRATEQLAQSYCRCYFNHVRSRWNYYQYTMNPGPDAIDQQLDGEGTTNRCLVSP